MKKLTITVDDDVYSGLHALIGKGNISRFLNNMAKPHVVAKDIAAGYAAMAADDAREEEAGQWAEHTMIDFTHDQNH